MRYLYPRLPIQNARTLYADYREAFEGKALDGLRSMSDVGHAATVYAATGGERVPVEKLESLSRRLRDLADDCGWPDPPGNSQRASYDARGSKLLADNMEIIPADAGAAGVWRFMTLVLAPEIPPWRWPTWDERRFLDHPRNTFRNQYWRGYVLGTRTPGPLDILGEDELVSVIERPSLSGNPDVARVIYSAYLPVRARIEDHISTMFLMRDYAKRLRRLASFESFDSLSDEELHHLCSETLDKALEAAGSEVRTTAMPEAVAMQDGTAPAPSEAVVEASAEPETVSDSSDHRRDLPHRDTGVQEDTAIGLAKAAKQRCSACDATNEASRHPEISPDGLKCAKCHGHLEERCGVCQRFVTRNGCKAKLRERQTWAFKFATAKQVARAERFHFTAAEIARLFRHGDRETRTLDNDEALEEVEVFSGGNGSVTRMLKTGRIVDVARP